MFGGMNAFDEDPYSFQDLRGGMGAPPISLSPTGGAAYTVDRAYLPSSTPFSLSPDGGEPWSPQYLHTGASQQQDAAPFLQAGQTAVSSIANALKAKTQAKLAAQGAALQQALAQGQISQQLYQQQMQQLQHQSGGSSPYKVLWIIGGLILVGGLVYFLVAKKRS